MFSILQWQLFVSKNIALIYNILPQHPVQPQKMTCKLSLLRCCQGLLAYYVKFHTCHAHLSLQAAVRVARVVGTAHSAVLVGQLAPTMVSGPANTSH